ELVDQSRELGLGERDLRALDAAELEQRLRVAGARCATFSPHAARVHPGKLLSGLAGVVGDLGVRIHEGTPVTELRPHEARTPAARVRARWVVRATEGYTAGLRGLGRVLAPINSSMIITAPLAPSAWRQIGWERGEVLGDGAHVYVYLQRTDDGRIAIGGRGVPYRFGSRTGGAGDTAPAAAASLRGQPVALFPAPGGGGGEHASSRSVRA